METAVCRVLRMVAHEKRPSSKERRRRKAGVCRKARRCVCARVACSSAASERSIETNQEIYLRPTMYWKMTLFMMFFYEPVSSFLK